MDMLQEMANGGQLINPAYSSNCINLAQELPPIISMETTAPFIRSVNHHSSLHHYLQRELMIAEGMDETPLSHTLSAGILHAIAISPSHGDYSSAILINTNNSSVLRRHPFSADIGSTVTFAAPSRQIAQRRSWQEALCRNEMGLNTETCTGMGNSNLHPRRLEIGAVENLLSLNHIQAELRSSHSATDLNQLTTNKYMHLEEGIAAGQQNCRLATTGSTGSFLSALSKGDEAFFKQQLMVSPGSLCRDNGIYAAIPTGIDNHITGDAAQQHKTEIYIPQTDSIVCKDLTWDQQQEEHSVNGASEMEKKKVTETTISSAECIEVYTKDCKNTCRDKAKDDDDDDKVIRTNRSKTNHRRSSWVRLGASEADSVKSKKRCFNVDMQTSAACCNPMSYSKRIHLAPSEEDSSPMQFNMSRSHSMNTSAVIQGGGVKASTGGRHGGSKRHPLGPALNTNLKPRAQHGTATDPQTVSARNRRERINARLKVLQELVPNGSKVDLVTMLEKAINYVKFLQLQLRVLSNDELWQAKEAKGETKESAQEVAMHHLLLSTSLAEEEGTNMTTTSCSDISASTTTTTQNK